MPEFMLRRQTARERRLLPIFFRSPCLPASRELFFRGCLIAAFSKPSA